MSKKIKKVLITGITGYIGKNLAKRFLDSGIEVFGLIRKSSKLHRIEDIQNKIRLVELNDLDALTDLLNGKIDVVYHLASKQTFEENLDNIKEILEVNINLGVTILEIIKNIKGISFVNTTTYWTHSEGAYSPVNLYSATKQAFTDILTYYAKAYEIPTLSLRLYDVYGLDDYRNRILNILLNAVQKGEVVQLTKGEQEIDLVHIDDVIDGFFIAGEYLLNNEVTHHRVYELATRKAIKIKDLVTLVSKYSGKELKALLGVIPYRKGQIFKISYQDEILPNWKPKIYLDDFLKKVFGVKDEIISCSSLP